VTAFLFVSPPEYFVVVSLSCFIYLIVLVMKAVTALFETSRMVSLKSVVFALLCLVGFQGK